ncbi:MAG: hypothetical protein J7621_02615 [Niastella sp.]|nr:hypothetical protein [Niastella sp.]
MTRFLLILVAFSVLNQSIDLDYITSAFASRQSANMRGYDDIDSITEFVIEQIMDDEDYIPEQQNEDDGMPKNKGVEKFSWNPLCCQFFQKVIVTPTNRTDKASQTANQQDYPTCKGYFHIVSPPPDCRLV